MTRFPVMLNKLQAGTFPLNFCTISFPKYSHFFVHEPEPVIRAVQLGVVTAPYPASPPSEPGWPRSGIEQHHIWHIALQDRTVVPPLPGPVPLRNMSDMMSFDVSFLKCSQLFVHVPDPYQSWSPRCCNCTIPSIPFP